MARANWINRRNCPFLFILPRPNLQRKWFIVADNTFSGLLAGLNGMLKSIGAISLSPEKRCRFCGVLQFYILSMSFSKFYITKPVSSSAAETTASIFGGNSSCKCALYLESKQTHRSGCVKAVTDNIAYGKNWTESVRRLSLPLYLHFITMLLSWDNSAPLWRRPCSCEWCSKV